MKQISAKETPMFSIIVVALNPGEKWKKTIKSVLEQSFEDYEIVVKDGCSKDGWGEELKRLYGQDPRIRIFEQADKSIYDAMNQAIALSKGQYLCFLNCGDTFYDKEVLKDTAKRAEVCSDHSNTADTDNFRVPAQILYGDTFCEQTRAQVHSAPKITGFTCYRNIPCHQSCFYGRALFAERQYDLSYRIRADYEHFLWCYYKAHADMIYLNRTVAAYEGGGYSESPENEKRDRQEHRLITRKYMSKGSLLGYHLVMALTLAPLRRKMAQSSTFSGMYHKAKECLYGRKGN